MVAKDDSTHLALSTQFADRKTTKIYQALVCGHPPKTKCTVNAPIARHPVHRKKMAVVESGRPSNTDLHVVEVLNKAALVEATLHTGRTHQIRVHLQHLGCPLVGDPVYGGRLVRNFEQTTGYKAPRQLLHATALGFIHPVSGKKLTIETPLPEDFVDAISSLKTR